MAASIPYTAAVIPGVILAAGLSLRMGQPKALLRCGIEGRTFVHQLALTLSAGGVAEVLVVGRPADEALRGEVDRLPVPARYVANAAADGGQLTSVLAGLAVADRPGVSAMLITPVDAPLIAIPTVSTLIRGFQSTRAPIVRAVHRGRHGHPVIFGRQVFDELRAADLNVGARAVVRAHADLIVNVEVDDPGVLGDVDTPGDYRTMLESQ
jgi:molybdenum cofactor cytidylyltransferase